MAFPVLLDTCALFGITLGDLMLRLAERETFRPLWSETILQELHRNLVSHRGLTEAQATKRVGVMRVGQLYESPFSSLAPAGPEKLFRDEELDVLDGVLRQSRETTRAS